MRILFWFILALAVCVVIWSRFREVAGSGAAMSEKDALVLQREKDLAVIGSLKENGSDLRKPHRIEHHFITYSKDDAETLLGWGEANGFERSELSEGEYENQRYFYFDLIKATVPAIENIFADTSRMEGVGEDFNCEYDGWGCAVVR